MYLFKYVTNVYCILICSFIKNYVYNLNRYGGIIPVVAKDLHEKKIEQVVTTAMAQAGVSFGDLDAIATTVKPGMQESPIMQSFMILWH